MNKNIKLTKKRKERKSPDGFPSETTLEETKFSLASAYQLKIASRLWMGEFINWR